MKIFRLIIYLVIISGFSLIVGCSPKGGYNILSFFFDGVPDSLDNTNTANNIDQATKDSLAIHSVQPIELNPKYVYHKPYLSQNCESCHDKSARSSIIMTQPALCYTCHVDFQTKFKYLHGPVAGGYCTKCHAPHMSPYPKLLRMEGQQLCTQCHSLSDVMKNPVHAKIENTDCLTCHQPHGSEKRNILR